MSFYIKQYRAKKPLWEDSKNFSKSFTTTSFPYLANTYKDSCIEMAFQSGISYYLQVDIKKDNKAREITVQLQKDSLTKEDFSLNEVQTISKIQLQEKTSEEDEYKSFNFIFTPNRNYSKLSFIISRDLKVLEDWDSYVEIRIINFKILNNLLDQFKVSNINQLGIHADPGTLMCINGEEIKIGKRGVFEINNDIVQINFLNIVNLKENSYYTIDYRYTKEDSN